MTWVDIPYFPVVLAHMWTSSAFGLVKKLIWQISKELIFIFLGCLDSW
jgi:hypothetical protein